MLILGNSKQIESIDIYCISHSSRINPHIAHAHARHRGPDATQTSTILPILEHHPRCIQVIHIDRHTIPTCPNHQLMLLSWIAFSSLSHLELILMIASDTSIIPIIATQAGFSVELTEDEAVVFIGGEEVD